MGMMELDDLGFREVRGAAALLGIMRTAPVVKLGA